MAKEKQSLVKVDDKVVATWQPSELREGFVVETSLPQKTPEDRARILGIIEDPCVSGEELIGKTLWFGHYILHPITLTNEETGEITNAVRTLLPQPDGSVVAFVSIGVIRSLGRIAWATGTPPPYDPPVLVVLKQISTGRGRRTYKLVPVSD